MDPNDGDVTVSEDGGSGISRRDAIKKGAIVGGAVVWATPVIQAIGINPAGAQTPSPTNPGGACPGCANCTASARGLATEGLLNLTVGGATGTQCNCTLNATVDVGTLLDARSQTVCGRADSTMCRASALVEGLEVDVIPNLVRLRAGVLSSCVNCGTGASQVLDLKLLVTLNIGILPGIIDNFVNVPVNLTVPVGCNSGIVLPTSLDQNVLGNLLSGLGVNILGLNLGSLSTTLNNLLGSLTSGLSPLLVVTANEQTCTNGTLTVRALHVVVAGQHVIVAESKAGGPGCACAACSPNPTCTPPTTRLC